MLVKDYMMNKNNDNVQIELHLKESRVPNEVFYELMWKGLLHDIPEEYQNLEVINEGYAIGAKCNVFDVYKEPDLKMDKAEMLLQLQDLKFHCSEFARDNEAFQKDVIALEMAIGLIFDDMQKNSKICEEEKNLKPYRILAEDIQDLEYIKAEYSDFGHTTEYTISASIQGIKETIHYIVTRHDEGEESYSIHTDKNDIYDRMEEPEFRRLEERLSDVVIVGRYIKKLEAASNLVELNDVKYEFMEDEHFPDRLTGDFWAAYYEEEKLLNERKLEERKMGKSIKYIDEKGHVIEETEDGYVFIDGSCVAEPGTDADFDRYAVEVQNGDGYYDADGRYRRYRGHGYGEESYDEEFARAEAEESGLEL